MNTLAEAGKGVFCSYVDSAPAGKNYARSRDILARCGPAGVEWIAALVLWQELPGRAAKTRRPHRSSYMMMPSA